jgi:hypothetical protein
MPGWRTSPSASGAYLHDVVTEHRHFKYGKADFDATYARTRGASVDSRGESMAQRDSKRMVARTKEREMAAEKVLEAMKAPMVSSAPAA